MADRDDGQGMACDLTAIEPAQRQGHQALLETLLGPQTQEVVDRPDGYALRFRADEFAATARFIDNERRCCPFLRFVLEVPPGGEALWLEITGPEGARDVLRAAAGWGGR